MRILIVEDETKIARLLRRGLSEEGHAADVVPRGEDALWMVDAHSYDAILLDVMLPGIDGFETCKALRAAGVWAPVLMLTARDAVTDRVAGLDAGADDYLVKPFAADELTARLRALLRRGQAEGVVSYGDLSIDPATRVAHRGDSALELTAREADLLLLLLRNAGRVVSREQALHEVWGGGRLPTANTVDRYVAYLRAKLGPPPVIHTVRGVGFQLRR